MGPSPFDAALSSVYKSNSIENPVRRGVGSPALFCLLKRDIRLCRLPDVLSLRCRRRCVRRRASGCPLSTATDYPQSSAVEASEPQE